MAKAVKLADIAERLGVSAVTVSKALSGQKGVSAEMREKIIRLADELKYKQPSAQQREKTGKSYNIGVLIADRYMDNYDSFYWQMYQLLVTRAADRGCFTLMEVIGAKVEEQRILPRLVQEKRVDGVIVIGRLAGGYLDFLREKAEVPLVFMDFSNERQDVDAVISDSFYGAYCLTNYLFDMGHTKIGFVGTLLVTGSITDRYLGYLRSLMEHGQQIRRDWVIDDRDRQTGELYRSGGLKLPEEMPTAFLCNCDLTASILIRTLKERGLCVPEDVSVAGYDNYLIPGLCDVALTTYEVDMKEMARRTLRILMKKMNGENCRNGISIVEGHMVIGESVKKPGL